MNQVTSIRTTAIATAALIIAVIALALAWVAYDRTEHRLRDADESSLNQTGALQEQQNANGNNEPEAMTVPQSQP